MLEAINGFLSGSRSSSWSLGWGPTRQQVRVFLNGLEAFLSNPK